MPGRLRLLEPLVTLAVLALVGVFAVAVPLRLAGRLPLHRGLPPPLASPPAGGSPGSGPAAPDAFTDAAHALLARAESRVHLSFPPRTPSAQPASTLAVSVAAGVDVSSTLPTGASAAVDMSGTFAATGTTTDTAAAPSVPATDTNRIGILAGHWQYDTGTVCPDGRREVDVTLDVAHRTKNLLEARGYTVDLLPELDPDTAGPPLQGYRAAAFVSVHADSCSWPGYSGFKISRWRYSNIPTVDDRLVACLYQSYADATGLPRHENTVSINMWNYYAFRELAAETPAAIIELGFMLDDRAVLDGKRFEMADGLAKGVACFLGR